MEQKLVYISKNYSDLYTASSKAKIDAENIVRKLGYKNIGLPQKNFTHNIVGRIWTVLSNLVANMRMPKNGIVFIQYPVYNVHSQIQRAKQNGNKVIILVHDINILRNSDKQDIFLFNHCDVVIAHSEAMKNWLIEYGIKTEIVVLEIFDYLINKSSFNNQIENLHNITVAFAGNLVKSKFITKLQESDYIRYNLFGIKDENIKFNSNIKYNGCLPPEKLIDKLNSNFGLVWDGTEIYECTGDVGTYLKYIAPHKLSLYLAAGMPVIVWKKSAMCDFVIKNGVGVAVESLADLEALFKSMPYEDYTSLYKSCKKVSERVRNGEFLTTAIIRSQKLVNYHGESI